MLAAVCCLFARNSSVFQSHPKYWVREGSAYFSRTSTPVSCAPRDQSAFVGPIAYVIPPERLNASGRSAKRASRVREAVFSRPPPATRFPLLSVSPKRDAPSQTSVISSIHPAYVKEI